MTGVQLAGVRLVGVRVAGVRVAGVRLAGVRLVEVRVPGVSETPCYLCVAEGARGPTRVHLPPLGCTTTTLYSPTYTAHGQPNGCVSHNNTTVPEVRLPLQY